MKMKWEVCNSLVHNTAKSGFARVNFKIKFTSEKRKAVTLTTYSSTQVFFIFSKDERLQGNLLTQRITTLIWSLCEQSVQRTPVYLLKGANKKKTLLRWWKFDLSFETVYSEVPPKITHCMTCSDTWNALYLSDFWQSSSQVLEAFGHRQGMIAEVCTVEVLGVFLLPHRIQDLQMGSYHAFLDNCS